MRGKKPCCCCRRTCFFKLYADKLEKRRFTQNVQPQKITDYFGITVEELMGTKKEPAGMGGLKWEWADVEAAYKNATPEARAAAKAAALAVLENGKVKEE